MLEDARAAVLVTQGKFVSQLPKLTKDGQPTTANHDQHRSGVIGPRSLMVCLDKDWEQVAKESSENPIRVTTAENLAYMIYTSGSTGEPKGVAITHASATAFLSWVSTVFNAKEMSGVLASTSICFDLSVFEIFSPLSCGGRMILVQNALGLTSLSAATEVTLVNTVPSALNELLRMKAVPPSVRTINLAGEPLKSTLVQEIYGTTSASKVYDLYGPSEDTTYSTFALRTADGPQTIGKPITNTQIYILDGHLQPVPIGIAGELYIGGAGLARGYYNRPELTAEKFIPDPFGDEFNSRLYRTGDLARYRSDGSIEFLGRMDNQVKIRGFRIELGEIEAVLGKHPMIREAVVLAPEDRPGDRRLVAHVVLRSGQSLDAPGVRSFLKQTLPEYMVPSSFVFLDSLPLTANGKIDRKALPEPDQRRPELEEIYVAPRTPVEEMIAGIWAEVLRLGTVGVHDDFFDLGGHSLLATQAISRICQSLQVEVPLRALFEGPTVAELAWRIEDVRAPELRLSVQPLAPVRRDKHVPLSFSQQRLWFLDQYEPNSSVYNVPSALRLRGCLNVAALERSLDEIVRRHESLRTTFSLVDGEAVQVIAPSLELSLPVVDLRDYPEGEREERARCVVREEARRPFDLSRGPVLRVALVRFAEQDYVLLLTMHHIVSDGWSMGVLHRELSVFYQAFVQGQPSPLAELPLQYADFAVWQREWLQGEVLESQLSYWKRQLEGISAVLNLPTDRPRPAVQSYRGARQSILLSKELTGQLKALSRKEGVTLFMTLLAAFQTLLYRYTGQEDIAVGSPIANRNRTEIEGLIGFFVNTLVLRTRLSGDPTFKELLAGVKETTLGAYAHQDLPFEKLVEELNPERNLGHSPLFQVMFALQNAPQAVLKFEDLRISSMRLGGDNAKFDLTVSLNEQEDGILSSFEYATDLFDDTTILRMMGHFRVMLEGIVVNPEQRLSHLPILTETEEHQLLILWNSTQGEHIKVQSIHELFEEQVEKSPDGVAVVFEEEELTYRELNERANQVAHYLIKKGVGPDVLVPICMVRSVDMVIGILAILKAGGAYVPLDPSYPKERLALMIGEVGAPVLLTQLRVLENLAEHTAHALCLDKESKDIAKESRKNFVSGATSDNLVYVLYTSGSTGIPKGVTMSHGSLLNLLSWQLRHFSGAARAITVQFASLSFDVSFQEIFTTLCSGGTLVVIAEELRRDAAGLLGYLKHKSVERLFLPFVALQQLAEAADSQESLPHTLREVMTAGEQLQVTQPIVDLFSHLKNCKLHNQYGPTESHVVTAFTLTGSPHAWPRLPPIGRPIANTEIYILDSRLSPVPIGVPGELYIGGDGLARGYLKRPKLTAEKFLPNPFSKEPGARLYKAGDLARYLPDGNIEFLGRMDHQVKIRGFRIELGEIETVLSQHPGVREAAVIAQEDATEEHQGARNLKSDKRLVAFVVPRQAGASKINELRSFLRAKLPEYMVPSAFVFLDRLPLTPNGKLDRKALPVPDQRRPELEEVYVGPRTPIEELLAEIWAGVLKLDKVGIEDNFFDLGGHSLLATQAVSRICQALQMEIPLRALFESPTVAGLAERIEATRRQEHGVQSLPMLPVSREKDLPLSFAQERLWFLDQYEPNSSVYNVPSALRLRGCLNVAALERSLTEIIRRHESLRTTFSMIDGEAVQVIAPAAGQSLAVVDLRDHPEGEREEEARRLVREEARRPFDLAQGPLCRSQLVRLGEDDHVLVLTMHHIVSDGWSMGVFYGELSMLYGAFVKGEASPLAELSLQYADFAVWQREWLRGEVLDSQLTYWKKQLEGIPAVLNLPTDRPRPAVQSFRGARQSILLSKELTGQLKALSRKEGVTLFMTLLAAFQTLLHRYTGQEDIAVGSPIANRNRTEIEGLIGFFVNTLVLRTRLSGDPTFKELLAGVKETTLGAYAHQDLPFEKLVEEIHPERSVNLTPLFQVLFNMANQENSKLGLLGLTVEPISSSQPESKFDLTLYVREENGQIRFNLVYRTDLFNRPRMMCFLQQYEYLLEQIVAGPEKPIGSYSLVTPQSRPLLPDPRVILVSPPQQLVTSAFLSWSKQIPTHPAISQGQRTWSYAELAQSADTLARLIVASGLAPGEVVAVSGQPSFGLIAAMIATFLSGGIVLPLDRTLPIQRKQRMLREAKAKRLLYVGVKHPDDVRLAESFTSGVLFVDPQNGCALETEVGTDLRSKRLPKVKPDDPAYVFFTSGTTGVPKGVLGCHKGLSHFLSWQRETFAIGSGDRVAQLMALSFDAVLRDIFLPLTSGATLCLPDADDALASDAVIGWLGREKITVLHAVPSLAQSWLASEGAKVDLGSMRWVFFMGEPLTAAFVRQWRTAFHNPAELVNFYGPTETTLIKCCYRVPADLCPGVQPVGWAMPNTQALVLAEDNRLCGINEQGEIVLRTPFRSLGYINAPEENHARFIKNPFRNDPQDLIYFTGDAGCYAPDGSLQILGRRDDQIKIRGVRIEPGEVTAILARHPLVHSCIVVGKKSDRNESTLVAYVVASGREDLTAELRAYLLEQLPAVMVPSAFVFLDALPLTPNGKVDRKVLPEPDRGSRPTASYVAPRNEVEKVVAGIWAQILNSNRVGIHDNFFDLGGHSLLATQTVLRLREALGVEVSLRVLFEKPTVAGLSGHIETIRLTGSERNAIDRLDEIEEIVL